MSNLNQLFELADTLNSSVSNEGSEAGLTVVGSAQLWDLLQFVWLLKASNEGQPDSAGQSDAEDICKRLVDSEEHAVDAAVPEVAFEAAEVIKRLSGALKATQSTPTLSQTMQYVEKADKFVHQVGALSIWDYDQDDGTPYQECDEPDDGFLDSHTCLMGLIEQARALQEGSD